jgi:hypothetical protein
MYLGNKKNWYITECISFSYDGKLLAREELKMVHNYLDTETGKGF